MKKRFLFLKSIPFFQQKAWIIPLLAGLGLGFALFSVLSHKSSPRAAPPVMPPQSPFFSNVAGIGVVEPQSELIEIGTELPGVVRRVVVQKGQNVKKGTSLFELDTRDIDAQIALLTQSLSSARIQAQKAQALFDSVRGLENDPAVSKDEFNRRYYGEKEAVCNVEELKARLHQAQTTKERLVVRAPMDGRILDINVRVGEYAASPSAQTPLILMGDVRRVYVRVEFDEENIRYIRPHIPAYGFTRDNASRKIPLTFVRVEPYVRPKQNLAVSGKRVDTRVLQVIYALAKDTPHVFMGQQMDVFVESTQESHP